jgi:hypothetical protein
MYNVARTTKTSRMAYGRVSAAAAAYQYLHTPVVACRVTPVSAPRCRVKVANSSCKRVLMLWRVRAGRQQVCSRTPVPRYVGAFSSSAHSDSLRRSSSLRRSRWWAAWSCVLWRCPGPEQAEHGHRALACAVMVASAIWRPVRRAVATERGDTPSGRRNVDSAVWHCNATQS